MLLRVWPAIPCALALWGLSFAASAQDVKAKLPDPAGPIPIIVETPGEIDALLKKLARPDFLIESGAEFDRRAAATNPPPPSPALAVVESIEARGEVFDELARLTIDVVVSLANAGPTKVSLGLDGLTVTEAGEGDRAVMLMNAGEAGWQVELRGAGRHAVRIRALGRVKPGTAGTRLDFGIPQVAATAIDLNVGPGVRSAQAGGREPVAAEPVEGGQRTRLLAHLSPRKRIDLSWRVDADAREQGPPLLNAQGAVALSIDPGSLQARSSWLVRCEQGTARVLTIRVDPEDKLQRLEIDDRPEPLEGRRDPATGFVTIPLSEPLRAGNSLRLVVSTRRTLGIGSDRVTYRGTPIEEASTRSGVLAIARSGDLAVFGAATPALRQIDPRTDLPQELRGPSTILAYQFFTQPLGLELRVEPATPGVRVESRTTVIVEPRLARVEARLDYQVANGQIFEVPVEVAEGFDWESAGPDGVVSASRLMPQGTSGDGSSGRMLVLTLSAKAREAGNFSVVLRGRQALDPSRVASIGLFRPRQATCRGVRVAVLPGRNVEASLATPTSFNAIGTPPPVDWPWPEDRPSGAPASALWLRAEDDPASLPLKVALRPRAVRLETVVSARFDRRRIDVQQETTCRVQNDSLASVDVVVPREIEGLWDLEGAEVSSRRRLSDEPGGVSRYRLTLAREAAESVRLRFRYRLPWGDPLIPGQERKIGLPWVRIAEGDGPSPRFELVSEPGLALAPEGKAWERPAFDDPAFAAEEESSVDWVRPAGMGADKTVMVRVTLAALAELPSLLASRLWLRTAQGPDGGLLTTAWYRVEAHGPSFSFRLPDGARLERVWIGAEAVSAPERLSGGEGYRLTLPSGDGSALLVGMDYASPPTASGRSAWGPPTLLDGGRVQRSAWSVHIPWNRAIVGVPSGWTDENEWFWGGYLWRRRPLRDNAALSAWVAGPGSAAQVVDGEGRGHSGDHDYLFGRTGDPTMLGPLVASRAWLIGLFSGATLLLGLTLIRWRPSARWAIPLSAALALAVLGVVEPNVALLGVQSSVVGAVLVLVAAATQHVFDRRPRPSLLFADPSNRPASAASDSGRLALGTVGSDESTVIRTRAASTAEHVRAGAHSDGDGYSTETPHSPSRA